MSHNFLSFCLDAAQLRAEVIDAQDENIAEHEAEADRQAEPITETAAA